MADPQLINVILMRKAAFYAEHQKNHVGLDETDQLWAAEADQYIASITGAIVSQHVGPDPHPQQPTMQSIPTNSSPPNSLPRRQTPHPNNMATGKHTTSSVGSSVESQPMSKKRSSQSGHGGAFINSGLAGPPLAPLVNAWQSNNDEPFSAFAVSTTSPRHTKARKTATGCYPLQIPDVRELDPADFIKESQATLSPAYSRSPRSRRNSNQHLSPLSSLSRSPATSSDGINTIPTSASVGMSREDSLGKSSFYNAMKMMRVDSRRSDTAADTVGKMEISPSNADPVFSSSNYPISDVPPFDFSLSVSHAQGADDYFSSPLPLVSNNVHLPLVVEEDAPMSRTVSSQSSDSSKSRVLRRCEEQAMLSTRPIAPKDDAEFMSRQSSSSSFDCDMTRQRSADGTKVAITKAKYTRPQHEKIKCNLCDIKPGGFRGPHELRRHLDNKHAGQTASQTRKVWVCKDRSPDQKFLSKCKHCMENKKYGAYYNAAAHLRRIHWNPKEKGKKGTKSTGSRGGNGGGNHPSMDILKLWIEDIDVPVTTQYMEFDPEDEIPDDNDTNAALDNPQQVELGAVDEADTPSANNVANTQYTEALLQESTYDEMIFGDLELSLGDDPASDNPNLQNSDYNAFNLSYNPDNHSSDINYTYASPVIPSPSSAASQQTDSNAMTSVSVGHNFASGHVESIDMSLISNVNNPLDQVEQFIFSSSDGFC